MTRMSKTKTFTFVSRFGTVVKIKAKAELYNGMIVNTGQWLLTSKQSWRIKLMLDDEWKMSEDASFYASSQLERNGMPARGFLTENILPSSRECQEKWLEFMRDFQAGLREQGVNWNNLPVQEREAHKIVVQEHWLRWHQKRTEELRKMRRS